MSKLNFNKPILELLKEMKCKFILKMQNSSESESVSCSTVFDSLESHGL